jgi:hypothetical protein
MGDSYSSGAGIAPVTDAPCSRSSANYASLVAEQWSRGSRPRRAGDRRQL